MVINQDMARARLKVKSSCEQFISRALKCKNLFKFYFKLCISSLSVLLRFQENKNKHRAGFGFGFNSFLCACTIVGHSCEGISGGSVDSDVVKEEKGSLVLSK